MDIRHMLDKAKAAIMSQRGRNVLTFLLFVLISLVLWIVMTLNEEVQKDLKCRVEIVNKPDSVTMVSYLPETINVSVKTRGTDMVKYHFGSSPVLRIDYKYYIHGNTIDLGESDMRTLLRQLFGSGAMISNINPDSLNLIFTSLPPHELPVIVDSRVTADASAIIAAPPRSTVDVVKVYAPFHLDDNIKSVSTYPVELNELNSSRVVKVRLRAPEGCRVVPDSVDVRIDVERLLVTTASVPIETINVPKGVKLLLFPNRVDASYMVTARGFDGKDRGFKVVADYDWLSRHPEATSVVLKVIDDKARVKGVSLAQDSVKYMIER